MELQGDMGHVESCLVHLETLLVSMQERRTICAKCTTGSDIISDAPDGTPR